MSKSDELKHVLSLSRNGADSFHKIGFGPFVASNGVVDVCNAAGCFWLTDILASEVAPKLIRDINSGEIATVLVHVEAKGSECDIKVTHSDTGPAYFTKHIGYTDFPEGNWPLFEMGAFGWTDDGLVTKILCHLISEH